MKIILIAASLVFLAADRLAAQHSAENLGNCLVGNTTGKERILLARWIGYGIAAHPAVSDSMAVPKSSVERTDQEMGKLVSALILERCIVETSAALATDGNAALEQAFATLGEVAMNELMGASEVNAQMMGFVDHLNKEGLEQLYPGID
jgi:hypothetical protein